MSTGRSTAGHIEMTEAFAAHNYHPLPVVLASGQGAWVRDVAGRDYLDALAGYSALNFGHAHPRLVERARRQLETLTLTSRAFYHDQLGPFARDLAALVGKEAILPMNSGAEAVETALKVTRRWGRRVKGVPEGAGVVLTMDGNFHGRTTTVISFSTDEGAREDFGPFTPGFRTLPYGDLAALEDALAREEHAVGVLLEPIQGEGGVVIPPEGFLRGARQACDRHGVLLLADEIQSGLARSGRLFACDHEGVVPDIYILGKALGGGILPVSAIAADRDVMDVLTPGSHGSTFGGNPLACAVAHEVVGMLADGEFARTSAARGDRLAAGLEGMIGRGVNAYRCRGLWAGVDVDPAVGSGRAVCERLMERGVLAKETQGSTLRLAPPLVVTDAEIDLLLDALADSLAACPARWPT